MRGLFIGGIFVGVLLGLALGLAIAWFVWPFSYTEADPADLRLDLKDDYLRMIAATYSLDGDIARASQRLGSLQLAQPAALASDLARRESEPQYQQALIHFSLDLNQFAVALARPTYTPRPTKVRSSMHRTPTASARFRPTSAILETRPPAIPTLPSEQETPALTPEPTLLPPTSVPNPNAPRFEIQTKTMLNCWSSWAHSGIQVEVQDGDGNPLPGVAVEVNWNAGDQVFYTGLKPERGIGFADVNLAPGTYNLRLIENARSDLVENLRIESAPENCTGDSPQVRGWKLTFRQVSP